MTQSTQGKTIRACLLLAAVPALLYAALFSQAAQAQVPSCPVALTLGGQPPICFTECRVIGSFSTIIQQTAGDDPLIYKQPGPSSFYDIVLTRPVDQSASDISLWSWRSQIEAGRLELKNGTLILFNQSGAAAGTWSFQGAWPSKITAGSSGQGNMVESVTLVHEQGLWTPSDPPSTTTTTAEPVLVTLSRFEARPGNRLVVLEWATEAEIDTAGFNIYRSNTKIGPYRRINTSCIPATGSPVKGASYSFTDTGLHNGRPYFYRLEDIDIRGAARFHGPAHAVPRLRAPMPR